MGSAIGKELSKQTGLGDLPESCVAMVLMNLEPKDICCFATLNKAFCGASSADFIWESKLPSNYHLILHKLFHNNNDNLGVDCCKKEIYATLSRFNSIDDATKKVWLDKTTGGICMAISAKGLSITGIDDRRYWNHIPTEESRFSSVAYHQQVWWFEVNGEVDFPFPEGTYSVFFRVQLGLAYKKFGRRFATPSRFMGGMLSLSASSSRLLKGSAMYPSVSLKGQGNGSITMSGTSW